MKFNLILAATLSTYTGFVALSLLRVQILVFAWPYPFLLSVQRWVESPSSNRSIAAGWLLGFGIVVGWAYLTRAILMRAARSRAVLVSVLILSLAAWTVPILEAGQFDYVYAATSILEVMLVGSLVFLAYLAIGRRWEQVKTMGLSAVVVSLVSWYVPLVALQALSWAIASRLGWSTGE